MPQGLARRLPQGSRRPPQSPLRRDGALAHSPGVGLNSAAHGGIFITSVQRQEDGTLQYAYRPPRELGPDWHAFDRAHEHDCLVQRPRSSASKKSRFDSSIYGIEKAVRDGEEAKGLRLRIREAIIEAGGWPVKDAAKWFAAESQRSPAFAKLFPERIWREWLVENDRRRAAKEEPSPLAVPGFAPVRAISVDGSKPVFFDAWSLAAHGSRGAKNPTERNVAIDLYECPPRKFGGKPKVVSRPVLHPRFATMPEKWRALGHLVPEAAPLPSGARFVARITKRFPLCLPLDREGEIVEKWEDAYRRVWFIPTALKTDGHVKLAPAEFIPEKLPTAADGGIDRDGSRLFGLKLKSGYAPINEGLLTLLRLNGRVPPA